MTPASRARSMYLIVVGRHQQDPARLLLGEEAGCPSPSISPGILMSMMTRSGFSPRKLDGGLAVAGLADHLVTEILEHLAEIEPGERLILGDNDTSLGHRLPPRVSDT